MKAFKKMVTMFMAVLMICSLTANAMAAEAGEMTPNCNVAELVSVEHDADGNEKAVYECELTPEAAADGDYGIMPLSLDQTFTMGSTHRGGDRTYSGNKLQISVKITDANGNAVDNMVSVWLHDYNHSSPLYSTNVSADGHLHTDYDIPITPGRTYYFYYQRSSGASRTLKVRMIITDYNG